MSRSSREKLTCDWETDRRILVLIRRRSAMSCYSLSRLGGSGIKGPLRIIIIRVIYAVGAHWRPAPRARFKRPPNELARTNLKNLQAFLSSISCETFVFFFINLALHEKKKCVVLEQLRRPCLPAPRISRKRKRFELPWTSGFNAALLTFFSP